MQMMRTLTYSIVYISALLLAACAPSHIPFTYSMDVQQGTILERERLERLEPGMTRRQVEFLLGSPTITDPFREDRWDYIYTLRQDGRKVSHERVTVLFEGDRVSDIVHDLPQQAGS